MRETARTAEKKTVRYGKGKNAMKWKRQGDIFEMGKRKVKKRKVRDSEGRNTKKWQINITLDFWFRQRFCRVIKIFWYVNCVTFQNP